MVFCPNEYLENETGYRGKQLPESRVTAKQFDGDPNTRERRQSHVLDNLEYTHITLESLKERGLDGKRLSDNRLMKPDGKQSRRPRSDATRSTNHDGNQLDSGTSHRDANAYEPDIKETFQRFRPTVISSTHVTKKAYRDTSDPPSGSGLTRRARLKPNDSVGSAADSEQDRFPSRSRSPPKRALSDQSPGDLGKRSKGLVIGPVTRKFVTTMPPPERPTNLGRTPQAICRESGTLSSGDFSDRKCVYEEHDEGSNGRNRTTGSWEPDATWDDGVFSSNPSALATPKRRSKPHRGDSGGDAASGPNNNCEHGVVNVELAQETQRPLRKRKKNLRPDDVKKALAASAMADRNALTDAEALWQMFLNPVYGDPTCPEEDFSDLAVRFARRGLRWIRMALAHGITLANRRIRSESRAYYGYGSNKPGNAPQLFSAHDDYDQAKTDYLEQLMATIREVGDVGQQRYFTLWGMLAICVSATSKFPSDFSKR